MKKKKEPEQFEFPNNETILEKAVLRLINKDRMQAHFLGEESEPSQKYGWVYGLN